ncbi:Bro-N domain-containing protein [Providencia rettgeri]|uniref:Antirepressor protein n=1 Tax=Providencia rettgeri TaxID=587 RepID=A0AAE2ZD96_PRORE|nr:BRO family protein [Providencia rettgeri]QHP75907.1 antirepressor protein [Proteus vulgaris]HCI97626.1 antirepressor protein [Providencia sp.]AVL74590.1 antirepressor protein [Providencia rettgeri]EJD6582152.1 antirepressor protein [Providencia rettgeri]ELR5213868.1 antirepressor protein [Providencia rettgeri]
MKLKNNSLNAGGFAHPKFSEEPILNINSDDISVIRFEGVEVRIVKINNDPWFVAKDVCDALEILNSSDALKSLDLDEKNTIALNYGIQGNPNRQVIAESGFYKLIARSRKATTKGTFAHRFTNWVFRDVIPSIRKTGAYGVPFSALNDFTKRQQQYQITSSQHGRDLQSCKQKKADLQREERELWEKYQPDFLDGEIH